MRFVVLARSSAEVSVAAHVPRRGLRPSLLLYLALALTPSLLLEASISTTEHSPSNIASLGST